MTSFYDEVNDTMSEFAGHVDGTLTGKSPRNVQQPHFHRNEYGFLEACYHKTRLSWKAWIIAGVLAMSAFPVEHYIWTHVPPFSSLADRMGLIEDHGADTK